jgi:hypothetical protein
VPIDEDLQLLEIKLSQLKRDYEHYFMGTRPREPVQARSEVQKAVLRHTNEPIRNTAARFKFNTINSRFQAFKRQWDSILRQIEAGTYKRHVFKAKLHEREASVAPPTPASSGAGGSKPDDLFASYRDAAMACGQNVDGLTPAKLAGLVKKREAALKKKLGCDQVNFRVVVEKGKVKLKASAGS